MSALLKKPSELRRFLPVKSKRTSLISAQGVSKAKAGAARAARPKSSASSSAMVRSTLRLSQTAAKKTLQAVIRGRVSLDAVVHSDKRRGYDGLVDVGYSKHCRVNHSADEFVNGNSHINGIESFCSYSKRRLQKFNGVSQHTFYLHLKESEYRFNHRKENLFRLLLKLLERHPL